MDFVAAFKDFGYPAVVSIFLLVIVTKNLESLEKQYNELALKFVLLQKVADDIKMIADDIKDIATEARAASTENRGMLQNLKDSLPRTKPR